MGSLVSFGSSNQFTGYYAPSATGGGPSVVVLQEWWGLVGHITDVADRFAAAGFNAIAPDLYHGKSTTEPDEAGSLMMALNIDETVTELQEAVNYLLAQGETSSQKVGVIGFCMGGQLSTYAATMIPQIGAAVNFYGIHPNVHPKFADLNGPLLGIFAERDDYASAESVKAMATELDAAGKSYEFVTYPNTDHAFFNDQRPAVYNAAAAADAWERTITFFRQNLVS